MVVRVRGDVLEALEEAQLVFERILEKKSENIDVPKGWELCEGKYGKQMFLKTLDVYGPECKLSMTLLEDDDEGRRFSIELSSCDFDDNDEFVSEYVEAFVNSPRNLEFVIKNPEDREGELERAIKVSSMAWILGSVDTQNH